MTIGNAGISGTEFSPIGSVETLGKDGPARNFNVIRQKGDSVNRGAAETTHKHCACYQHEKR
ncbi:MAG: hypothetical protein ACPGSE_03370 [Synechococcus sp.]